MNLRFKKLALVSAVSLALAGCGGSDSSSGGVTSSTLEGVVADGYLEKAIVCLDLNDNKACDVGEPTDESDADGNYSLANISASDRTNHSIVVQVTTDTIDADTGPVLIPYTITAPVGKHAFVSPISTMIQTKVEQGASIADAETAIKQAMGYNAGDDIDLFANFIEEKANDTNSDKAAYQTIALVAQITARALQDNQAAILSDLGETTNNGYQGEIINLIVQQVLEQMDTIVSLTVDKIDTVFSVEDLDAMMTLHTSMTVDLTTITAELEQEAFKSSADNTFNLKGTITADGVFYFDYERFDDIGEFVISNVKFIETATAVFMMR